MQLFLDLRGIVQKSRAQFWLNLVSKGKTSHSWVDSEISLVASDWHMRLQWKVTICNKNMIYIQERFHGCHWNLNVWQRVSRGMMMYDDLFFATRRINKGPIFGHIPTLSRGRIPIYGTDKHQYRGLLYTKDIAAWDQIWNWLRWVKDERFRWCTQKPG